MSILLKKFKSFNPFSASCSKVLLFKASECHCDLEHNASPCTVFVLLQQIAV